MTWNEYVSKTPALPNLERGVPLVVNPKPVPIWEKSGVIREVTMVERADGRVMEIMARLDAITRVK